MNSGCSQLCISNIDDSYTCSCQNGYELSNDNHTCTDIDECTVNDNGGCEQICHNTNGSYYCSCLTGYLLSINDHNCTGKAMRIFLMHVHGFYVVPLCIRTTV